MYHTVLTLNHTDRDDSCQQLLSNWDSDHCDQYGDSERGTLLSGGMSGRPPSQCPTCGTERTSAYLREIAIITGTWLIKQESRLKDMYRTILCILWSKAQCLGSPFVLTGQTAQCKGLPYVKTNKIE